MRMERLVYPAMKKNYPTDKKPYYRISSLVKGLQIVEFLAENNDLSVTEIARALKQDRSTCNRFLMTLKDLGYIATGSGGRYRPTLKMFEIGNKIASTVEVRPQARGYMKKLAGMFGETVNLGRLDGFDVVTIDVVSGQEIIRFDAPIGNRSPIHTLAMGKAILAYCPEEEQKTYLASAELRAFTQNTIVDKSKFRRELSRIRKQGYATDNEEWALGIRCVAVPIFDYTTFPSHAISISGPSVRLNDEQIARIVPELKGVGRSLSNELGAKKST